MTPLWPQTAAAKILEALAFLRRMNVEVFGRFPHATRHGTGGQALVNQGTFGVHHAFSTGGDGVGM